MWIAIIAATLMSLIGYRSLLAESNMQTTFDNGQAETAAADMATYQFAVVEYANANPIAVGAVSATNLTRPIGYTTTYSRWSSSIAVDGTIIIYAVVQPPVGLSSAINRLVGDSTMVVETDSAGEPTSGTWTGVATIALANRTPKIPNAPVWFAHRG